MKCRLQALFPELKNNGKLVFQIGVHKFFRCVCYDFSSQLPPCSITADAKPVMGQSIFPLSTQHLASTEAISPVEYCVSLKNDHTG
jgi:hypothetical protein